MSEPVQIPQALDTPDFREAWKDWLGFRTNDGRKAYSDRAKKQLLKKLTPWGAAAAVAGIQHSISADNDWKTVYPDPSFKSDSGPKKKLSTWEIKEKLRAIDNRLTDSDLAYEHVDPEKNRKRIAKRRELIATRKDLESQLLSS
ncbi:MAG: hypothetical protein AAGJ81_01575 [Verrucomicrobiota bacterium]